MTRRYEVLWFTTQDCKGDPATKEFATEKAAMDYYNRHKHDKDKFSFWVTKRDEDWGVVEDYIY